MAARKQATPAQITLAWLLAKKLWLAPIPGTRQLAGLGEDLGALAVKLTTAEVQELTKTSKKIPIQGVRAMGNQEYG